MPSGNLSPIAESRPSLAFNLVPPPSEATLQQNEQQQKIRDPLVTAPNRTFDEAPEISEDDIRKSLIVEAKRRKYWGTKAITKMLFEDIQHSTCYHYMLESFTETRSTAEATEACASTSSHHHQSSSSHNPTTTTLNDNTFVSVKTLGMDQQLQYTAQLVCGSPQLPPNPWDFDIQPDQEFADQTKVLEMPSSNRMSSCHVCNGDGVSHCFHCRGFGTDKCQYCRGTGMKAGVAHPAVYTHPMAGGFSHSDPSRGYPGSGSLIVRPPGGGNLKDKPYAVGTPVHFMAKAGLPPPGIGQHDLCIFCQGRGISDCHHCKGQGKKSCPTCGGQGNVRVFTKLKVFFTVECSDYYTPSDIPEILLRGATGSVSFAESQNYVLPLKKHPIKEINEISKKYCATHLKKAMGSCRLLKQRHCVEAISIAKIKFKLGNKNGFFYVYGKQRLCWIPKNPSKCSVM